MKSIINSFLKSSNFIFFIGAFSILPFLVISVFNNPFADDFCYHNKSRDLGFWKAQSYWYNEWSGRYFASAILSLKSLISESFLVYKLIPILLICLLFIALYLLSSAVFSTYNKRDLLVITFFILSIFIAQMPSIVEGFYWLAGAVTYQLSNILTLFFLFFLIELITTKKNKFLILSTVFSFFIIGSNEISMLLLSTIVFIIFGYKSIQQRKINLQLLTIVIAIIIFSVFEITAPGNYVRSSEFPQKKQLFYSLFKSVYHLIDSLAIWLPLIFLSLLVLFDHFKNNLASINSSLFKVNPLIICITVLAIPFIGFFIGYWSMGWILPPRAINTIYLYFLLGTVYLFFVLFVTTKQHNSLFVDLSKWAKKILFFIILIQMGFSKNIKTAYMDLIKGKAYHYNLELKNRYSLIKQSSNSKIYVPKLINTPKTIFIDDISYDSENWVNECFNNYFKPKEIILKN